MDSQDGAAKAVSGEKGNLRKIKPHGGKKHERNFYEAAAGSRRTLWPSDQKMEP